MSKLSVRFLQKTSTLVKVASQSNFHFTDIALVLTHILITSMKNIVLLILWKKIILLRFSLFYWKQFCSTFIGLNLFKLNCSNMVWNCSNWWSKLLKIDLNLFLIRFAKHWCFLIWSEKIQQKVNTYFHFIQKLARLCYPIRSETRRTLKENCFLASE